VLACTCSNFRNCFPTLYNGACSASWNCSNRKCARSHDVPITETVDVGGAFKKIRGRESRSLWGVIRSFLETQFKKCERLCELGSSTPT
jgi:hypothetical protein